MNIYDEYKRVKREYGFPSDSVLPDTTFYAILLLEKLEKLNKAVEAIAAKFDGD